MNARKNTKKVPPPVFLSAVIVIFFTTLSAADSIGFVPYFIDGSQPASNRVTLSELPVLGATSDAQASEVAPALLPDHIFIPTIGMDLPVQNIASHDTDVLDAALQNGPVRYVDSAKLGQSGNMLIFAHSSHLPIVHNKMFQAFNRLSELKPGDSITVSSGGKQFLYSVTSVRRTTADEGVIDLSPKQGTKLTLSTCDTLTSKSARFVVEADFVGQI